jgi:hypothetical protein
MKLAGKITPAQFEDRMSQLYTTGTGTLHGLLPLVQEAKDQTGDPNGSFQNKMNGYGADQKVQSYVNGVKQAAGGAGNLFDQTMIKNSDGTYAFHNRPTSEVTGTVLMKDQNGNPLKDANGHAITVPTYAAPQAFEDKKGNVNGFQYATNIDGKGQAAPGTGAGAIRQIDGSQINTDDPSGVPYFYNDAGQKKFIGKDKVNGKPVMANDPSVVSGKNDFGSTNAIGQTYDPIIKSGMEMAAGAAGGLAKIGASIMGGPGSNLGGGIQNLILGTGQHTQDRAAAAAALAKAQAAQQAYTQALAAKQAAINTAPPAMAAQMPTVVPAKGQMYLPKIGQVGYQNGADRALNNAPAASAPQEVKTTALVNNLMGYSPTNGM